MGSVFLFEEYAAPPNAVQKLTSSYGKGGQPESLSEIEFLGRRINHLQRTHCLYVIDCSSEKVSLRHAPERNIVAIFNQKSRVRISSLCSLLLCGHVVSLHQAP